MPAFSSKLRPPFAGAPVLAGELEDRWQWKQMLKLAELGMPTPALIERWALDAAAQKAKDSEGMQAWVRWGEKNAGSIVENGHSRQDQAC